MAKRRLQGFLDAYLKHYLASKQQEEQYNLQRRNQSALADESADLQMLEKVLSDASGRLPAALARGGKQTVGRVPIEALMQTRDQGMANVSQGIQKATTREQLPTQIGVERALGGQASLNPRDPRDVEAFLPELQERESRLTGLTPPMRVDNAYNEMTGAPETRFLPGNPEALRGQAVPTGPTPEQRGLDQGKTELSQLQTPGLLQGKIDFGNRLEAGTRGEKVATSAATAGAGERARLGAYFDPRFIAARIEEAKQKAIAEAAQAGNMQAAKMAQEAAAQGVVATTALSQLKQQYDAVKLSGGGLDPARAAGRRIGTMTGTLQAFNPQAAELDKSANGFAMLIYRGLGGTGANVSDRDISFLMDAIPYSHVYAQVGDKVFQNAAEVLTLIPIMKGRYATLPFEEQRDIMIEWRKLQQQARQAEGVTEIEDPFSPGKTIPVIK